MENRIIGAILLLSFVVGGVGVYTYSENFEGRFSNAEYKQIVSELPEGIDVIVIDASQTKVEVLTRSEFCDYSLMRITKDEVTMKCGYRIFSVIDFKTRYFNKKWFDNDRKVTKVRLEVREDVNSVVIDLVTPYYRKSGFRRQGNGGVVTTSFKVTKEKIKISQFYETSFKTLIVSTGVRVKRLEESKGFFIHTDPSFSEQEGNIYWYDSEKGKNLSTDPVLGIYTFEDFYEVVDNFNTSVTGCVEWETVTENVTNSTEVCVDFQTNITEHVVTTQVKDGAVRIAGRIVNYSPDRWCVYTGNLRIDCGQIDDSIHGVDPASWVGCGEFGGQDCLIHVFDNASVYNISEVNSDVYVKASTPRKKENTGKFKRVQ